MKFIAFGAQKGGSGKTTHCMGLASHLCFTKNKKVYILDADFPQHNFLRGIAYCNQVVEDSMRYQRDGHCCTLLPCEESNATKLYEEMFNCFITKKYEKFKSRRYE